MKNKAVVYNEGLCLLKDFYNETLVKLKPYDYRYIPKGKEVDNIEFQNRIDDLNVDYTDKINILVLKNYFKFVISSNYRNDGILFFLYRDRIILAKENLKIIVVFKLFKDIIGDNFVKLDDSIFYYGNEYNIDYTIKDGYFYVSNDELKGKFKIINTNSKLKTIKNITNLNNKEYKTVKYSSTKNETIFFGDKDYYINGFNNVIPDGSMMKLYNHLPFVVYETPDYTAFFSR